MNYMNLMSNVILHFNVNRRGSFNACFLIWWPVEVDCFWLLHHSAKSCRL